MTASEVGEIKRRAKECRPEDVYALVDEVRRLRNAAEKHGDENPFAASWPAIALAEELRTQHNGIFGVYLYLGHDGDNACTLKDTDAREVGHANSGRSLIEAVQNAQADWRLRRAIKSAADKKLGTVDESTPVGKCAVDAACSHQCLDDRGVPRVGPNGEVYTLWGRILAFAQVK